MNLDIICREYAEVKRLTEYRQSWQAASNQFTDDQRRTKVCYLYYSKL